ncbi:MAG: glycosyltransferase family 87 protein [Granulosicoccus sp.]
MDGYKKNLPLLLILLLVVLLTWYDGISRALNNGMVDFNILYVGSDLFVKGENPYFSGYLQTYLGPDVKNSLGVQITLPGAFALMAPLTMLDHVSASFVWLVLNLASMVASVLLLLKITGLRYNSTHGLLLIASCLMLGSFRMGIRQGQLDNMILLFCLLAVTLLQRGGAQRLTSAVLLGVAVALKPTSTGLICIYLLMRGKISVALASLLISGAIIGVSLLLLTLRVPGWSDEYLQILNSTENNFNKVNALNPRLELLTHLPAGLFSVLKSGFWASLVSFAICLPILLRTLLSGPSVVIEDTRETFLRELSIIALVSLLIVYHRFYSGVFLVFPVAWAVYCISKREPSLSAWLILSLPVLSIVNGQAAYSFLIENEVIGIFNGTSWFEQTVLRFHFVWIQLAALILLFLIQIKNTEPSFAPVKDAFKSAGRVLSAVAGHRGDSGYGGGQLDKP